MAEIAKKYKFVVSNAAVCGVSILYNREPGERGAATV